MKLLGWMHRKFRQTRNEPLKDLIVGQPSHDDQYYHKNISYGVKSCKQAQSDNHLRKCFASLGADLLQEDDCQEEPSAAASELFHGFLAFGTLGSEHGLADPPPTPTFPKSVENITEKDAEVTENELKLINDELEKVLSAEARDEWYNVSSGRTSHVSTGRSSNGSTITLSSKIMESQEMSGRGSTVCLLQDFLLGSAIEMSETTAAAKRENRTSLGELFQRHKTSEEIWGTNVDTEEKRVEKELERSALLFMKKKLKKIILHSSSSRNSTLTAGLNIDNIPSETTLNKILHIFHKKVHPENSASAKKSDKQPKNEKRKKLPCNKESKSGYQVFQYDELAMYHQRAIKEHLPQLKSQFNLMGSESNGNRECCIKTDADYLVLEL